MTAQPITRPRPTPRLRVLSGRRPRQRVSGWVVAVVLMAVAFFGLIYSQTRLSERVLQLQDLERQIDAELATMESLQLEVARLESPARVAPAAESLGMVFPDERHTLSAPGVVVRTSEEVERLAELKAALGANP